MKQRFDRASSSVEVGEQPTRHVKRLRMSSCELISASDDPHQHSVWVLNAVKTFLTVFAEESIAILKLTRTNLDHFEDSLHAVNSRRSSFVAMLSRCSLNHLLVESN